jgi:hypothetical protein
MSRRKHLRNALEAIEWENTRGRDDLASARGRTRHERLCHEECAAEFPVEQTE